jgi:hypothetical protein
MASRGSTRLSQPNAGLIDVDKLNAGLFRERRAWSSMQIEYDRSALAQWHKPLDTKPHGCGTFMLTFLGTIDHLRQSAGRAARTFLIVATPCASQ